MISSPRFSTLSKVKEALLPWCSTGSSLISCFTSTGSDEALGEELSVSVELLSEVTVGDRLLSDAAAPPAV